ncbi:MAG: HAMP domain-containing histidine kinase, partial [Cytophagales bacterium]|nr:HAMP domain-containing histidine kinase [Cytophagales bacterium]
YSDIAKPAPKISIDIEVTQERISVVFSDNGIGIAQEYLDKIFKMFFRASENSPGSGLGLFILMETVKKLGGSISVSSELTVGTSFFLELPNNPKRNAAVLKPEGELRY